VQYSERIPNPRQPNTLLEANQARIHEIYFRRAPFNSVISRSPEPLNLIVRYRFHLDGVSRSQPRGISEVPETGNKIGEVSRNGFVDVEEEAKISMIIFLYKSHD
jgi:hypothetical protein